MPKGGLEEIVDRESLKNYIKGEVIGETGAAIGSSIGGYMADNLKTSIGGKLFGSTNTTANVLSNSIPGDYLLSSLFSGAYWYHKYKDRYKGLRGKLKFIKEQAGFHLRELPATLLSYAMYAPTAALLLGTGLTGGLSALLASLISSATYIGGSAYLNRKYLKKIGGSKSNPSPNYATQSYAPAPSY